jgi:hypothetical protein
MTEINFNPRQQIPNLETCKVAIWDISSNIQDFINELLLIIQPRSVIPKRALKTEQTTKINIAFIRQISASELNPCILYRKTRSIEKQDNSVPSNISFTPTTFTDIVFERFPETFVIRLFKDGLPSAHINIGYTRQSLPSVLLNPYISCNKTITMEKQNISVPLNTTFTHKLRNIGFDCLSEHLLNHLFKDGRPFSHFIEKWLEKNYNIDHVEGCKKYDFVDRKYPDTKYDEKTFTKRGCCYMPSNMLGQGRCFNQDEFQEKTNGLVFCIVSNINFPEIKIRFVRGSDLIKKYPKGKIPFKDYEKFFSR